MIALLSMQAELIERDMVVAKTPLREIASVHAVQGQRDYIDFLHLSPMKIHLSFSMQAGGSAPPPPEGAFSGVKLLLKSFGFNLADIQGAILKLDYFERKNDFLTISQLVGDVTSHYTKQALKQFYVVILGLDVMGNPVGLLMGITTGVGDLFYEPLQGAIQGPEEFIAGLAQGKFGAAYGVDKSFKDINMGNDACGIVGIKIRLQIAIVMILKFAKTNNELILCYIK